MNFFNLKKSIAAMVVIVIILIHFINLTTIFLLSMKFLNLAIFSKSFLFFLHLFHLNLHNFYPIFYLCILFEYIIIYINIQLMNELRL